MKVFLKIRGLSHEEADFVLNIANCIRALINEKKTESVKRTLNKIKNF